MLEVIEVAAHRFRQRQDQKLRVSAIPDRVDLVDLCADGLGIEIGKPGAAHVELLAIARPGGPCLIDRALKANAVPIGVGQYAGFGMEQRTLPARKIRSSGWIDR